MLWKEVTSKGLVLQTLVQHAHIKCEILVIKPFKVQITLSNNKGNEKVTVF
jgi:hypothetical protein